MSLAGSDWSASAKSRIAWSALLCAVALGLVGMHGLSQGGEAPQPMGHHVVQAVDVVPASAAPNSPTVSNDYAPGKDVGPLTLCLMVLVPAAAVGLWLLASSRLGGRRLRRTPVMAIRALELAAPPQPLWRQLSVLRI